MGHLSTAARSAPCRTPRPCVSDYPSSPQVLDDEDQVAGVIAVLNRDVHAGIRHHSRDAAKLPRFVLPQGQHQDLIVAQDVEAGVLERVATRLYGGPAAEAVERLLEAIGEDDGAGLPGVYSKLPNVTEGFAATRASYDGLLRWLEGSP